MPIGLGFGLAGRLPVVVRVLLGLPGRLLGLPGGLLISSSDPAEVLKGFLFPTVSVGRDSKKSESDGELRNHFKVY